jgi:hypothetical protein
MKNSLLAYLICGNFLVAQAQVVPVTIQGTVGSFQLMRNGQPYFVKGGGGDRQLEALAAAGGNSMRTWGTDANTINFLNEAHALGLTVLMGLWVAHEAHGFDYNNAAAIQLQLEGFRTWVRAYKDHPAVLAWGIGNEVELGVTNYNPKVWNAINEIALMIKQEDGNHPTLTVVAGIDNTKTQLIKERAPDLDMIGINAYGGIGGVNQTLLNANWNKPYMITEWGPNGQWESPTTSWGAPIEASSTEKANLYKLRYQNSIAAHPGRCVGSYVFLWSDKFEETPTWYGLFLPNSSTRTQVVEEMQFSWTGTYPANRAPRITSATLDGKTGSQSPVLKKDFGNNVLIEATDPDGDALTYEFIVQPDVETGLINNPPATIPYLPGIIESQINNTAILNAPTDNLTYRLFIFVRDGMGHAATINIPFRVSLDPLISDDPEIIYASKDCYVRNGDFTTTSLGLSDKYRLQARQAEVAGSSRETFVNFYIGSINKQIIRVSLELYGNGPAETKIAAYPIKTHNWTETMAWGNKLLTTHRALDTLTLDGSNEKYFSWDVTNFVNTERFFGRDSVSFVLKHLNDKGNPSSWLSREARPSPPRLKFELTEGDIVLSVNPTENIKVFPNPTEKSTIQFSGEIVKQVTIVDAQGVSYASPFNSLDQTLTISNLSSGVYFLKVLSSSGLQVLRFIKI